tara:strand:- start:53 stop:490 length:438 start_codon:yes stop_codon:yes gene_type:complete
VKKKYSASLKDKKDWLTFTQQLKGIYNKELTFEDKNKNRYKTRKIDLHGLTLNNANKKIESFISESFEQGYKKLVVVTGKGLRSKIDKNPYLSKKMNVLRYSIPEYVKSNENLSNKISGIEKADTKDGGDGAIYIFLKNVRKFKE